MLETCDVVACRATWSSDQRLDIANLRQNLDEAILKMPGIHFFISCVTGTVSKPAGEQQLLLNHVKPGVAYFITYSHSANTNEHSIFATMHDSGVEAMVTSIRCRGKSNNEKEKLLHNLKTVLKVKLFPTSTLLEEINTYNLLGETNIKTNITLTHFGLHHVNVFFVLFLFRCFIFFILFFSLIAACFLVFLFSLFLCFSFFRFFFLS